jgi:hypothetical protein
MAGLIHTRVTELHTRARTHTHGRAWSVVLPASESRFAARLSDFEVQTRDQQAQISALKDAATAASEARTNAQRLLEQRIERLESQVPPSIAESPPSRTMQSRCFSSLSSTRENPRPGRPRFPAQAVLGATLSRPSRQLAGRIDAPRTRGGRNRLRFIIGDNAEDSGHRSFAWHRCLGDNAGDSARARVSQRAQIQY